MRNSFSPFNWVLPTDALECLKAVLPPMLHVVPTENGLEPWSSKVESSTSCHLHTSLSRHVKKPPKRHSTKKKHRLLCRSFADVHHLAPRHSVRQSQQDINLGAPKNTPSFLEPATNQCHGITKWPNVYPPKIQEMAPANENTHYTLKIMVCVCFF